MKPPKDEFLPYAALCERLPKLCFRLGEVQLNHLHNARLLDAIQGPGGSLLFSLLDTERLLSAEIESNH